MCKCGCNTCETKGPLLTEGKVKSLLSEGLQYHINKKIPLFETVYRIGSDKHLALIKEARKMYSRNIIDLCEEDEALIGTHLGEFALYEGVSIPLDLPMLNEEVDSYYLDNAKEKLSNALEILGKETGKTRRGDKYLNIIYIPKTSPQTQRPESVRIFYDNNSDLKGLDLPMLEESKYEKEESIQQTIDRLKARLDDPNDGGNVPFIVQKIKDLEKSLNEIDKISSDKLSKLIPNLPKGYVGKNAGIGKYTISTPDGGDIVLTKSKDKKNWFYEPSNVALKILNESKLSKRIDEAVKNALTEKKSKKDIKISSQSGGPDFSAVSEAEFKGKKVALGKPKRGGPKAYYVYVKDGDKVKKVTFGSGGLRAKIKNKEARNAFAARHKCSTKKDRTKAGYWSCNLPRYAPALGLGAKMNTFW